MIDAEATLWCSEADRWQPVAEAGFEADKKVAEEVTEFIAARTMAVADAVIGAITQAVVEKQKFLDFLRAPRFTTDTSVQQLLTEHATDVSNQLATLKQNALRTGFGSFLESHPAFSLL